MEYTRLGKTGLKVSRLCLGCMTYGDPQRGPHEWTMNEESSRPLYRQAFEAGINFFDTANIYSDGTSEEFLGRAVREFSRRDEVVIATKLNSPMRKDPNAAGLSRKAVMTEIDASLKRLGTDYVDLYQIHRFDYTTPIEETLEALHDVVKAGKARYIGASSMYAYQFCKALYLADLPRLDALRLHAEPLQPALPRGRARDAAAVPRRGHGRDPLEPAGAWAAHARLRRKNLPHRDRPVRQTPAQEPGRCRPRGDRRRGGRSPQARGVPRAQVALAWVASRPGVTAPIVGASKPAHLSDAVAGLALQLTPEEVQALEKPYIPHAVAGFS
jgi:aryl-alcohol dehydrogenase-like predicted oxidoreductase